ncbi:MAG: AzlD domain-containing protein [Alphaproteobacteria bacterium]|nr:AzlD domain-containing protein [Alphaproteobacteria bacterium]
MPDNYTAYLTIALVALTVFGMRIGGMILGAALSSGGAKTQRIVNALPGCAMAAIVAPAAMRGTPTDIAGVALTFGLYLWTGRTILSLIAGVSLCLLGAHWRAGTFG